MTERDGERSGRVDVEIGVAPADSEAAQLCLGRYFAELDARFSTGFDVEAGPDPDAADYEPPNGVFLIARIDEKAIGCGGVHLLGPADASPVVGEIKRMWVAEEARGNGVATALLQELERWAAELGFGVVRLDTNATLTEAHALYAKHGYRRIDPYRDDNPFADYFFEKTIDPPA